MNETLWLSVFPITAGAAFSVISPMTGIWMPYLPDVVESTFIYANLHACTLAGSHWGLAAAMHEDDDPPQTYSETKR